MVGPPRILPAGSGPTGLPRQRTADSRVASAADDEASARAALGSRQTVDIRICFSTKRGLFSRVLRAILRSRISHACLTYRCETFGKEMVLELQGRGFVAVSWDRWEARNQLMASYRLRMSDDEAGISDHQVRGALTRIADWLGTRFDYLSLLGFWLRPLTGGRVWFNSRRKLVCSGGVAMFLSYAGIDDIGDPDAIDPVQLHALVEERAQLFEREFSRI